MVVAVAVVLYIVAGFEAVVTAAVVVAGIEVVVAVD